MSMDKAEQKRIAFHEKHIDKSKRKIAQYEKDLKKALTSGRKKDKLQSWIDEENDKIEQQKRLIADPGYADQLQEEMSENSKFTKIAKNLEKTSEQMQSVGKGMTKAGGHITGAVWSPIIYAGYQGIKHARKQPKNESIEQDLIELIQEVEKAHNDGKITEEQKRDYIINFVDEFYKR